MTLYPAIFLISAATLALELILLRALSIGHWHHFSYLVISTALLGFGAGGTLLAVASKRLTASHKKNLWLFTLAFAISTPIVFKLCQKVPLDELQLIWDRRQPLYLFAYYLLFLIPFFCAGSCLALAFTAFSQKSHTIYFYNMTGSALGAAAAVLLMYHNPPERLILIAAAMIFIAALILSIPLPRSTLFITLLLAAATLYLFSPVGPFPLRIKVSQNKSLVFYRALPDSQTLETRYSPLGRLDCLKAPTIRSFPGLSFNYTGPLPDQMLIITDADAASPVNRLQTPADYRPFKYMTSSLPYHLVPSPNVCIIGAGAGADVAQALAFDAPHVTAVELNPQIIDLVANRFADYTANLYNRPRVTPLAVEGRYFLQTTPKCFDIINISFLDSLTASSAGLYALNESHLYTVEAVEQALSRLTPDGFLSITRMLKTPPTDALKMLATIAAALQRRNVTTPADHIIMLRSWSTATIVASPSPLTAAQIQAARDFAAENSFDLVHLPGLQPDEVNRYNILEEPLYYRAAAQILSPNAGQFFRDYPYNIRPATDDRPYFFDFFKLRSLPLIIRTLPGQWLPFTAWGYALLLATLIQSALAAAVLILLPLFIARPLKSLRSRKLPTFLYFLALGLAYMFLEMAFIQKTTLLIGHPILGVAVTIAGFLLLSALGALAAGRIESPSFSTKLIRVAVVAIAVIGLAETLIFCFAFDEMLLLARPARIALAVALIAPLAFAMGMPFPTGLRRLGSHTPPLVPWAWGINGFASVTAAVLGATLAISLGFTALTLIALPTYLLPAALAKNITTP